jgi:hypothetical protein
MKYSKRAEPRRANERLGKRDLSRSHSIWAPVIVRREVPVVADPGRRQTFGDVAAGEALPAGDRDCVQ